jgi:Na+-translocating ferredoxin:NAD+ oxidoreductase RnfG subunit
MSDYSLIEEMIKEKEKSIVEKFFKSVLPDEVLEKIAKKQLELEKRMESFLENDHERWIYEKGKQHGHVEMFLVLQKKYKEFLEEMKNEKK